MNKNQLPYTKLFPTKWNQNGISPKMGTFKKITKKILTLFSSLLK